MSDKFSAKIGPKGIKVLRYGGQIDLPAVENFRHRVSEDRLAIIEALKTLAANLPKRWGQSWAKRYSLEAYTASLQVAHDFAIVQGEKERLMRDLEAANERAQKAEVALTAKTARAETAENALESANSDLGRAREAIERQAQTIREQVGATQKAAAARNKAEELLALFFTAAQDGMVDLSHLIKQRISVADGVVTILDAESFDAQQLLGIAIVNAGGGNGSNNGDGAGDLLDKETLDVLASQP